MQIVPIPTTREALEKTFDHWFPFVERLAQHTKEPLQGFTQNISLGKMQIGVVWDEDHKECVALLGWQYKRAGGDLIAEILWLTGRGAKHWRHLLPELEKYLKEHNGCTKIRTISRPGWTPFLKESGYQLTHHVMEKNL